MKSIRDIVTEEQKKALRKVKVLPLAVKAKVYGGNKGGPAMAIQFNRDIKVYGLWEALLYVEGYEADGSYVEGTALLALQASELRDNDDEEQGTWPKNADRF